MGRLKEEQNVTETREIDSKKLKEIERMVQIDELVEKKNEKKEEIKEFFAPEQKERKKGFFSKLFKKKERFDFHDEESVTLEEALGNKSFDVEDEDEVVVVHKPAKSNKTADNKKEKANEVAKNTTTEENRVAEETQDISATKEIETPRDVVKTTEQPQEEHPIEKLELEDFQAMKEKARKSLEEKEKQFFEAEAARELEEAKALEEKQGKVAVAVEEPEAAAVTSGEPVDLLGSEVLEISEEEFQTVELDEIKLSDDLAGEATPEVETQEENKGKKGWGERFKKRVAQGIEQAPQSAEVSPENLPVPTEEPQEKEVGLVGQGFTSEVYMWDDNRVLKLYRDGFDKQICEKEFHTMEQVYRTIGICPRPYELVNVEGRNGAIYEYLDGKTMQKELLVKFWSSNHQAKVLAQLHYEMQTQHDFELITVKDKLRNDISMLHELTEREKLKLYRVIDGLPDGDRLCHFDLHPGNIIYKNGVPVIIDWADACIGDSLADVARTSVLLRYGRGKDQPFYVNLGVKIFQSKMVLQYQKEYLLLSRKNAKDIEQWELPIMAARIGEDIAKEEKELLVHYVKRQLQFKSIH